MKKALILILLVLMVFEGTAVYAETAEQAVVSDAITGEDLAAAVEATEEAAEEAIETVAEEAIEEATDEAAGEPTDETAGEPTEETAGEGEAEADLSWIPEEEVVYDYEELTVGTITPFEGSFFTGMWGNVASDLDIRVLVHGYDLVEWRNTESVYGIDPSVVSGIVVTQNGAGDRTYTLTIYNDLTYSDGTPITARDYAFSMLLSVAPQISQIGGSVKPMDYLVGYEDYISGATPYLAGVRIISEDTLAITVSGDYLPFFYELALLDCTPYPIHVIAPGCQVLDDGNGVYIANADPAAEAPVFTADLLRQTILDPETGYLSHPSVSSGPYRLVSFDGETVELELNEYYKGNSDGLKPIIPKLHVKTLSNDDAIETLARGEIGLINKGLSVELLQKGTQLVASGDTFTFSNYPRSGMSFISFSCEREPVNSAAVRQAIAFCMDKDAIVNDTVANNGLRVDGYYGMGQWMYTLVAGDQDFPVEEPALEATEAEVAAYEDQLAAWEALSLDNVKVYDLDVAQAVALLEAEGWTLNREGAPFDPEADDVRCKQNEDGTLSSLELKMLCPAGSSLNAHYQAHFIDHLAEAGILVSVEELPMNDLLDYYYRRVDRDYDMIALATNFDVAFDPAYTFRPDGEDAINPYNPTAINDQQLYELCTAMRRTEAGDLLAYCQKWIAFEERFQELEPVIPIFSNVYFDFYPRVLHEYSIASNVSWGRAVVGAYMSDVADEELEPTEGEEDDGEMVIVD